MVLLAPLLPLLVLGQVYRWVDKAGEEHFTNDRSSVPKGAKILPFEPGEPDVAIGNLDPSPPASPKPPEPAPAPAPPEPRPSLAKRRDDVEPNATVTLGELPRSLKQGDAEIILGAVQHALDSPRLKTFGGLRKTIRLDVIEKATDPRMGGTPEWAAGFAVSSTQVYLLSPYIGAVGFGRPRNWAEIALHEIAHAQQAQWSGTAAVPRWFKEGYAMYVADEEDSVSLEDISWWAISKGDGAPLSYAFKPGARRPILRGAERADHAGMDYGLSYQGVKLMVAVKGVGAVSSLLRAMKDGLTFDAAFKQAIGLELKDFEALLLEQLRPHFHERAE